MRCNWLLDPSVPPLTRMQVHELVTDKGDVSRIKAWEEPKGNAVVIEREQNLVLSWWHKSLSLSFDCPPRNNHSHSHSLLLDP